MTSLLSPTVTSPVYQILTPTAEVAEEEEMEMMPRRVCCPLSRFCFRLRHGGEMREEEDSDEEVEETRVDSPPHVSMGQNGTKTVTLATPVRRRSHQCQWREPTEAPACDGAHTET